MSGKIAYVILGATGNQGSHVVKYLYSCSIKDIYVVTRDVNNPRSKQFEQVMFMGRRDEDVCGVLGFAHKSQVFPGVKVIAGDLENKSSLVEAFKTPMKDNESYKVVVFAMSTPSLASNGYAISAEVEEQSGRIIVEAAEEAKVTHIVYSSVANCDKENRPKYHRSKKNIEDCLKASKNSWTILRPVSFYETWARFSKVKSGCMTGLVKPDVKQQWVSLHDLGASAATVLRKYEQYKARTIDLVADELSGNEMAEKLTQIRKQETFRYSIAWFMRLLLWVAAHDIYEERVTFPEKEGGYKANKQDLLELSKTFSEEEFKRKGLVNFERVVMLNGWHQGPLASSWGIGDYAIYGLGFLGACFATMAYLLPESVWTEIKKRWAFYGLMLLFVLNLLIRVAGLLRKKDK
ncbi:hypothetical protein GUITHDRAFT_113194 [Guillardia theta CCMP2712]|uniref:NmrA-like domain-containing protein n=1 Tax=Guillardia theta (strain CCMP2712) TaxID=905079 RepID=L1IXP8_GUITC|nr:hypothetical protein GUITHDRAFT_113194 [Guillardia theta CCMP2712]EKX40659.1 hypothetical protein GUITHDRAFT_113194 [Guillardia theta CCMP2712]|eukprot:XP_005827639.1 hypothetical protein GUITHDRAFT_113194 [Guillardia theta CCMP2712]